ncbi:hypothetical protein CRG98_045450 [Punica granatum]|uniref:Yippee domain-containing protein n=1 Tax=Punica granatum TaxID=22663 RepID=A0A2I0HR26_PUNGR|nr:hypothetical protein CRG98_045450 [Punica granatum]
MAAANAQCANKPNVIILSDDDNDNDECELSTFICTACTTLLAHETDLLGKGIGEDGRHGAAVFSRLLNALIGPENRQLEEDEMAARILCTNCSIPLEWKLVRVPRPHDMIQQGRDILHFSRVSRIPVDSSIASTSSEN